MTARPFFFWIDFALPLWLAFGCSADDDDLIAFQGSPCKKESFEGARSSGLRTRQGEAELMGLQCLAWQTAGENEMAFDLLNFVGACGARWEGRASVKGDNSIELTAVNPDCLVADCGLCIYDWSFHLANAAPTGDVDLEIAIDTCPGEQAPEIETVALPLASQQAGMICRYVPWGALQWHVISTGESGLLHMPCADSDTQGDEGLNACGEGLVCEPQGNTPDERICLATCQVDADCPLTDLLACQQGRCRLSAPWI